MTASDDESRGSGLFWMVGAALVVVLTLGGSIAIPKVLEARKNGNETAAIGGLRTLGTAQSLFRECEDPAYGGVARYATLAELGTAKATGLIYPELASGTKDGYVFECSYSATTSEFLWFATARPLHPGVTGDRCFVTNQEGVIYYRTPKAFRLNTTDCTIPSGLQPVSH